jgi:hypothetical protein
MYILCTYANGPYWRSSLEPLLYPSGCSFYRPFSYRPEYLSDNLVRIFSDRSETKHFLADDALSNGVFGISFNSTEGKEFYETFIPLRFVELLDAQGVDEFHLYFRLGDYIKLDDQGKFRRLMLNEFVNWATPKTKLMIDAPDGSNLDKELRKLRRSEFHRLDSPVGLWDRFIKDESLSDKAKKNFSGATILRLLEISERGKVGRVAPALLKKKLSLDEIRENGYDARKVYGFDFTAGKTYEVQLAYHRLVPTGSEGEHLSAAYEFVTPTEDFDVSKRKLLITGNYRYENIWVKALRGRPAPTSLEWTGTTKEKAEGAANESVQDQELIGISVPVMSQQRFWTIERGIYAVLAFVFGLAALFFFFKAFQLGSSPAQLNQPPSPLIAISTGIGAFCAGTSGSFLQSLIKALVEDGKS